MFIGATESIRKYAVIKYPWNISANTPRFTGLPPHIMLMVETQQLKQIIEQQTAEIIQGVQGELDRRHFGGDRFQADGILQEVMKVHERIADMMNSGGNWKETSRVTESFPNFLHIEDDEEPEEFLDDLSFECTNEHAQNTKKKPPGIVLSWKNCKDGKIKLLPKSFMFPSMPLPNLTQM